MKREVKPIPFSLAFLFACLPMLGWWATGLFDVDEGFYGAVVAEMNRRHEWITPYFNGQPWFEKPILLYWLAKPCLMVFGPDFGPRVPSFLCTVALFAVVAFFMKRRYGNDARSLSILFLGSSLLVVALGRLMMTDAPLHLALTTAFLSFFESLVGDRRWRLLTAFCLGIGVLAKGPVALILFVLVAGMTVWRVPSLRTQIKGYWLAGTAILIATIAVWYVPCYLANGEVFVQKFLIEQNVGRFLGGDKAHSLGVVGLPFYIPLVIVGIFPWGWIGYLGFTKENFDDDFSRYLLIWTLAIFGFFTISNAKLPHYILPVFSPLAMLVAKQVARQKRMMWVPAGFSIGVCILYTLVLNFAQSFWFNQSGQREAQTLARKHPEIDVLFSLSRQEKALNTGTTKLQETSLPSLIMYLNHEVIDTGDPAMLVDHNPKIVYSGSAHVPPVRARIFFTRRNRLANLGPVSVIEESQNFGVYMLRL